jgi:hypothetical protein
MRNPPWVSLIPGQGKPLHLSEEEDQARNAEDVANGCQVAVDAQCMTR